MPTLIDHLRSFNRGERYYLLETALGKKTFTLDSAFRTDLGNKLGLTIPANAYVAMDYHLDWLALALYRTMNPGSSDRIRKEGALREVNKSPIDTDLLVAFRAGGMSHIVLIEAKGDTPWSNSQMAAKVKRLGQIFGDETKAAGITPYFVLLSPDRPQKLTTSGWPGWMKSRGRPVWMPLAWPKGLLKATRSDVRGRPSERGRFLSIG